MRRAGVSPVIAVLLLIAIAVAVGIMVYVWVTGLTATLTATGGQQVSEQLSMVAYDFTDLDQPEITLKNTGTVKVSIDKVYFDGVEVTATVSPSEVDVGSTVTITITLAAEQTRGTSHIVTITTTTGAIFKFTIIAGRAV